MKLWKSLTEKSWLPPDPDAVPELRSGALAAALPPAKVGLRVFLAVVAVVFSLFMVAYYIRMELADWRPLPEPMLLWVNTAIIILSSVALQITRGAVQRGNVRRLKSGLAIGGLLTAAFLVGQLWVCQSLVAAGYYAVSNPANAFFYVLTTLHALHLLGGLVVWVRTASRVWRGAEPYQVRLSVELCTTYWHFLALIWLGILWVLIVT